MENSQISKSAKAFGLSLAVMSVVNSFIVILKEKQPVILAAMKSLTGHHWITHVAIVMLLFFALGLWLNAVNGLKIGTRNVLGSLVAGVALGALLIVGFYLVAD